MKSLLILSLLGFSINCFAVLKINGAGASFPYAIYSKWISEYSKVNKDIQINYQSIGSGGGIRQLIKETVDFAATDAPMKKKDKKKAKWPVLHIPTVLGAVVVAYNGDSIGKDLKISGSVLADIFLGKITKWNDKAIKSLNPKRNLPDQEILVVRRADSSGTTSVFSSYLSDVSQEWKSKIGAGKSLRWPTGIGAKGNEGVTALVKQTEYAIGYIDLAHAMKNNIYTVSLKNKDGKFVKASVETISSSAKSYQASADDFTASLINKEGSDAYPISAFTYFLLPIKEKDSKLSEIHNFFNWSLSDGQKYAKDLYYAPLPKNVADKVLKKIKGL
ncbi:MAG: phosphate ABC transporter substrate-binding protein PstS [Bdellovibrionota bacterium]|nr:phosphate ABC transporter substrate-binding protein PstS [Bdellovibrionota bacterium]